MIAQFSIHQQSGFAEVVWRLGQTQPVKAVFAVYKDAMDAQALALMGRKMVRHEVA